MSDIVTVRQQGTVPMVTQVPAWAWRCDGCGWSGYCLYSETAALKEASDHAWDKHRIAVCAPIDGKRQWGHPGHRWEHVKGSDSTDKCARCGDYCGK